MGKYNYWDHNTHTPDFGEHLAQDPNEFDKGRVYFHDHRHEVYYCTEEEQALLLVAGCKWFNDLEVTEPPNIRQPAYDLMSTWHIPEVTRSGFTDQDEIISLDDLAGQALDFILYYGGRPEIVSQAFGTWRHTQIVHGDFRAATLFIYFTEKTSPTVMPDVVVKSITPEMLMLTSLRGHQMDVKMSTVEQLFMFPWQESFYEPRGSTMTLKDIREDKARSEMNRHDPQVNIQGMGGIPIIVPDLGDDDNGDPSLN